jgi:hypothetical protein
MSVNWNQEWKVTTPGGGLGADDSVKFESLQIKRKKAKASAYDPSPFGTYSPALSPTVTTCTVTVGSAVYTIDYQEKTEPDPDQLVCQIGASRFNGEASATSGPEHLSWILGGTAGMAAGFVLGLLLDVPWSAALAIASTAAFAAALGGKVTGTIVPTDPPEYPDGSGGPSWTAIEGG